jgi:GNAT superfamily N-acetyltransferase
MDGHRLGHARRPVRKKLRFAERLRYVASMSRAFAIRLAGAHDAPALPAVEQSAGALFRSIPDLAWVADEAIGSAEDFLPAIAARTVWVGEDGEAGVIGELRGVVAVGVLHMVELEVAIEFQRRGLGRQLLDIAIDAARARGLRAITLTTFRHVPWNAPFYARYGFVELKDAELDARLRQTLVGENARGLLDRCAMCFPLA